MDLVEGESPRGPLPLDEALGIACQIADALEYSHDKGVTHRDLKPGNIKIKPDGTVSTSDSRKWRRLQPVIRKTRPPSRWPPPRPASSWEPPAICRPSRLAANRRQARRHLVVRQ
jgi:serine/threonine protein kinase